MSGDSARLGRCGKARLGGSRPGPALRGSAWQGRLGGFRPGMAVIGMARPGMAGGLGKGSARLGKARLGLAGFGRPGESRHGESRHGDAWRARAWQAWKGAARSVEMRHGETWQGRRGKARLVLVGRGLARRGAARRGMARQAWNQHKGVLGMNVYEWREGLRNKPDCSPEEAHKELEKIRAKSGGQLAAPDVVKAAKRKTHKLHDYFEWRDQIAGAKWREQQARTLIGGIKVRVQEHQPVRAYQHVKLERPAQNNRDAEQVSCYTSTEDAMADPAMRQYILNRALSEADSWRRKYEHLEELSHVFDALDKVAA